MIATKKEKFQQNNQTYLIMLEYNNYDFRIVYDRIGVTFIAVFDRNNRIFNQ